MAGIDAPVKNISRQTPGKESVGSSGPREKYTHPLRKTDAAQEMNITILFFLFFSPYGEILQGQGVCVTMKRGKA